MATSEIVSVLAAIRDASTIMAIVAGGTWAVWKWGYAETIRKKREMASPDGTLTAISTPLPDGRSILTLTAVWRNRGALPIELCSSHSSVEVYKLDASLPSGSFALARDMPHLILIAHSVPDWEVYVMEPNTDSQMQQHFILVHDSAYGFKWTICLTPGSIPGKHQHSHFKCTRELICQPKDCSSAPT